MTPHNRFLVLGRVGRVYAGIEMVYRRIWRPVEVWRRD